MALQDKAPFEESCFDSSALTPTLESLRKKRFTTKKNLPIKRRRNVRFNSSAIVVQRAVTNDDLKQSWYHASDYDSFDHERRETISALYRDLESLDTTKYCLAGLEQNLTKRQVMRRKRLTMQCRRAVLELQLYQKISGNSDPESLKKASRMFSLNDYKGAILRAVVEHSFES
jgi:hypothetical protein